VSRSGQPVCQYFAVSASAAAQALKRVKLLSADAPKLPLANCGNPLDCRCTYEHFDDRRQGSRRADEHVVDPIAYTVHERRSGRGRRVTDDA
jgi:hypothetical protein